MHKEEAHTDPEAWLVDPARRWLLVVGSHLGASSGVPLPHNQTTWSPSVRELVRYHIYQTQSHEAAEGLAHLLAAGKPPLGMIADSLAEQDAWLRQHTADLTPKGPILYLADLAKDGMFQGIVSAAYDNLLPDALARVQVPFAPCSLESPIVSPGALPYLREYDDTLFQDTAGHRRQEVRFLHERIGALLDQVDGVWLLGHPPYTTDLFEALKAGLARQTTLPVVWMQERLRLTPSYSEEQLAGQPASWVENLGGRAVIIETDDMARTLHELAERRNVSLTTQLQKVQQAGIAGLLNRTVDMRPVLVYVPGLSLFGEALKKLPRISLKAILSLVTLVLLLISGLHYRQYNTLQRQLKKPHRSLRLAQKRLTKKKPATATLLRAEKNIADALRSWKQVKLTKDPLLVLPQLQAYLKKVRQNFFKKTKRFRVNRVIPQLFRVRMLERLQEDQLMQGLSSFPKIIASRYYLPPKEFKKKKRKPIERRHRLAFYTKVQHRVLRSPQAMLLRVLRHKEMLKELRAGRLVFSLDLRKRTGLEEQLFAQVKDVLLVGHKAKASFGLDGIRRWLIQGKASFVFPHIDTAGSIVRALSRIEELLLRYPKCRLLLTTYRERTSRVIAQRAKQWLQLTLKRYRFRDARNFLRHQTSSSFFAGVTGNSYLRWNWRDPLVMAMLVEYYRGVGRPPRGLGSLYGRLLQRMLRKQKISTHRKFQLLSQLAYHSLRSKRSTFTTTQALAWLRTVQPTITPEQLRLLLKEATQQEVLRLRGLNTLGFVDRRFRLLFAARHLRRLSFDDRKSFLLQQSTLFMAFYVGVQPRVSRLVKAWLDDFQAIQALINQQNLENERVNPLAPSLVHAALAVHDGDVAAAQVRRLEDILFHWLEETGSYNPLGYQFARLLLRALDFLSTQGVKYRLLKGITTDHELDHKYMSLTARSSSDIYETAVMQWLQRVRTQKDKKTERRAFSPKKWKLPPAKRGRPYPLRRRFEVTIKNALTTLIQSGSPAGLRFVVHFITPDTRHRFRAKTWHKLRYHTFKRMFSNGHWRHIFPLFDRLARQAPRRWSGLFHKLTETNAPQAAALLAAIIKAELPVLNALLAAAKERELYREKKRAYQLKVKAMLKEAERLLKRLRRQLLRKPNLAKRREIIKPLHVFRDRIRAHKRTEPRKTISDKEWKQLKRELGRQLGIKKSATRYLAGFRKNIATQLFQRLLYARPQKTQDTRVYGAYGLSLMGEPKHFAAVDALIDERLRTPLWSVLPKKWRKVQAHLLTSSLANFGDARAFKRFRQLYAHPAWREKDPYLGFTLEKFVLPAVQPFALKRLLCAKKVHHASSLIRSLAIAQSSASRRLLNQLLVLDTVRDEPDFRRATCDGHLLPYKTIKKRLELYTLIEAIGSFQEPNDLPRLLGWATHPNFMVALEAIYAMKKSPDPTVTRVLWNEFLTTNRFASTFKTALKEPHRKLDETWLIKALLTALRTKMVIPPKATKAQYRKLYKRRIKHRKKIKTLIQLMRVHGSWRSFMLLVMLQSNFNYGRTAKDAVLKISQRMQGTTHWQRTMLLPSFAKPSAKQPPAKKPTLTRRPPPASRPTARK